MQFKIGSTVKGKISGITKFGAFVNLEGGKTGLVHISQISNDYVDDIENFLKIDQEVEATVLSIDEKGRIALSMRGAKTEKKSGSGSPAEYHSQGRQESGQSFEDMMNKFKSLSDEKISGLKKSSASRRGSSIKRNKNQ